MIIYPDQEVPVSKCALTHISFACVIHAETFNRSDDENSKEPRKVINSNNLYNVILIYKEVSLSFKNIHYDTRYISIN